MEQRTIKRSLILPLISISLIEYIYNRWDAKGLSGHSKIIFDALDNLVREIATKYLQQEGRDIINNLQDIVSRH